MHPGIPSSILLTNCLESQRNIENKNDGELSTLTYPMILLKQQHQQQQQQQQQIVSNSSVWKERLFCSLFPLFRATYWGLRQILGCGVVISKVGTLDWVTQFFMNESKRKLQTYFSDYWSFIKGYFEKGPVLEQICALNARENLLDR